MAEMAEMAGKAGKAEMAEKRGWIFRPAFRPNFGRPPALEVTQK